MAKEKQNALIVITFLIAVFLLGQWLWDNVPRYEYKKSIETSNPFSSKCYYGDFYECYCGWVSFEQLDSVEIDCDDERAVKNWVGDDCFFIEENKVDKKVCYIKEKIRKLNN